MNKQIIKLFVGLLISPVVFELKASEQVVPPKLTGKQRVQNPQNWKKIREILDFTADSTLLTLETQLQKWNEEVKIFKNKAPAWISMGLITQEVFNSVASRLDAYIPLLNKWMQPMLAKMSNNVQIIEKTIKQSNLTSDERKEIAEICGEISSQVLDIQTITQGLIHSENNFCTGEVSSDGDPLRLTSTLMLNGVPQNIYAIVNDLQKKLNFEIKRDVLFKRIELMQVQLAIAVKKIGYMISNRYSSQEIREAIKQAKQLAIRIFYNETESEDEGVFPIVFDEIDNPLHFGSARLRSQVTKLKAEERRLASITR